MVLFIMVEMELPVFLSLGLNNFFNIIYILNNIYMCDSDDDCKEKEDYATIKYVNKCVCKLKERTDYLQSQDYGFTYEIDKLKNSMSDMQKKIFFIDKVFYAVGDTVEINVPVDIWENGHIIGTATFNEFSPNSLNITSLFQQNYNNLLISIPDLVWNGIVIGTFQLKRGESLLGNTNIIRPINQLTLIEPFTNSIESINASNTGDTAYTILGPKITDYFEQYDKNGYEVLVIRDAYINKEINVFCNYDTLVDVICVGGGGGGGSSFKNKTVSQTTGDTESNVPGAGAGGSMAQLLAYNSKPGDMISLFAGSFGKKGISNEQRAGDPGKPSWFKYIPGNDKPDFTVFTDGGGPGSDSNAGGARYVTIMVSPKDGTAPLYIPTTDGNDGYGAGNINGIAQYPINTSSPNIKINYGVGGNAVGGNNVPGQDGQNSKIGNNIGNQSINKFATTTYGISGITKLCSSYGGAGGGSFPSGKNGWYEVKNSGGVGGGIFGGLVGNESGITDGGDGTAPGGGGGAAGGGDSTPAVVSTIFKYANGGNGANGVIIIIAKKVPLINGDTSMFSTYYKGSTNTVPLYKYAIIPTNPSLIDTGSYEYDLTYNTSSTSRGLIIAAGGGSGANNLLTNVYANWNGGGGGGAFGYTTQTNYNDYKIQIGAGGFKSPGKNSILKYNIPNTQTITLNGGGQGVNNTLDSGIGKSCPTGTILTPYTGGTGGFGNFRDATNGNGTIIIPNELKNLKSSLITSNYSGGGSSGDISVQNGQNVNVKANNYAGQSGQRNGIAGLWNNSNGQPKDSNGTPINVGQVGRLGIGPGGGGGAGGYWNRTYTGVNGNSGIFVTWFDAPPIVLDDNLYTTTNIEIQTPVYSGTEKPDYVILSTCGNGGQGSTPIYWNPVYPLNTGTGSGGSGGYIRIYFNYEFTYNDVKYTVYNAIIKLGVVINITKLKYNGSDGSSFIVELNPRNGTNGDSSTNDTDGRTGTGGKPRINSSNPSIPNDLYIYKSLLENGQDGGFANANGTANYTSSGSGVDTTGYDATKPLSTRFPNGIMANPPSTTKMSLPGSSYIITSIGGGKSQASSGYGSGGATTPSNYSNRENIIKGRPGFCQVMYIKKNQ